MEISAQNTPPPPPLLTPLLSPLLTLQWKQAASRLFYFLGGGIRFLVDRCQHVKKTQREWWGAEVARQGFYSFWGEKESQAGAHNQGDDYLFICMFVYLRVNNCE